MRAKITRGIAHFAARRIAGRMLRRVGLLRLLPAGLLPMLLAEGALLAWRELQARPELRQRIWQSLSAKTPRRKPAR
jgi:hypothetical protein